MRIRIKNKKRFGVVLSIVLVLIAMISGTYSLFYRESIAQSKEDYTTGILNIVAKSKSDNINLTNALPMTDEDGSLTEPYVFNIENVGNLDYNFKIRLLSTSENPINPDYIKLKIDDGEVTTLSALTNSVIKDNITLKAKETMDVTIRIWLASNTPNSEIGKSFNSRIVTEGQAVYTEKNNEDANLAQHITNLYNRDKKTVVTVNSDPNHDINYYQTLDYNYATSVSLMKDRFGATTTSLDDGNIRYYGETPNNYIDIGDRVKNTYEIGNWVGVGININNNTSQGCMSYVEQTRMSDEIIKQEYGFDNANELCSVSTVLAGTPILWRIIGVFDGKVRIIRDKSIGNYAFDTSPSNINKGYGINEWSQADLMKLLNPGYETNLESITTSTPSYYTGDSIVNNSLYWNSENGYCAVSQFNWVRQCDFTNSGLSNDAKEYIVDQTVSLGGVHRTGPILYSHQAYVMERSNNVFDSTKSCYEESACNDTITRTLSWTGKVSLPYPSDFGYAADFRDENCQKDLLYRDNCSKNWLIGNYWLISPSPDTASGQTRVSTPRFATNDSGNNYYGGVRPVLTLTSTAIAELGDGSKEHPYILTGK